MTTTSPPIALLDPRSFADGQPHEQFRWLREHDPVHRHAEPGGPGFWALTRYADVRAVGRDAATFSSEPTIMIPDGTAATDGVHKMMLMADGRTHTDLRRIISRDFVPRAARLLRPRIEQIAREIVDGVVDGVVERGECDLVTDVAGLMPSYVIAELLDIPHADGVALYELTEAVHAAPEEGSTAGAEAVMGMFGYAQQLWERKRQALLVEGVVRRRGGRSARRPARGTAGRRPA